MSPDHGKWPLGRSNLRVIYGSQSAAPRRRGWSPWVAVAAFGAHFGLRLLLDTWLNAGSDVKVIAALVILIVPLLIAAFALYRSIVPKSRR